LKAPQASRTHLLGRLQVLEARIGAWVQARLAIDRAPDDPFRGLYISDEEVGRLLEIGEPVGPPAASSADAMLARVEADADAAERAGADLRLRRLARCFELTSADLELLLVALAPDIVPRFERLFAYLHDDVSRRRASTGLALRLSTDTGYADESRARFHPNGPLLGGGLLQVGEPDRPFLTRTLQVPDRVASHLIGDDAPDELVDLARTSHPEIEARDLESAVRALRRGDRLFYVRERTGAAGYSFAVSALARSGRPLVAVDLRRLDRTADLGEFAMVAVREARLLDAGLVAGPLEVLADPMPPAVTRFAEAPCPVFLVGSRVWDPDWARELPIVIDAPVPTLAERDALWRRALNGSGPSDSEAAAATVQFRLTPEQVRRAAHAARRAAAWSGRPLVAGDLHAAARAQNAIGLERLARRVRPKARWQDLVLPADVHTELRELVGRLRYRELVLDDWGLGRTSTRGRGITCLFAGESGTGKTMAAEVLAGHLGVDLYIIDLSSVVDKYVGETEKNLDRVFAEADRINGVLLFDEADALFGKRSEVKDARDRWANVEVAYLLQRMEHFDGIAILTTNLRANLDEAFTRRLAAVVDFPRPDEDRRRLLWERNLETGSPLSDEIDLGFLAASFNLSGGSIRNVVLGAAYLAADDGAGIDMSHIVRAIQREYRKLGRLCVEGEFGRYHSLVASPGGP
jgi:hypothetical protein